MPALPVTRLLGALGLIASGPLVSTLLVGRTGPVPSVRWLGLALATWVTLAGLAWAVVPVRRIRAVEALAPLAVLAPFVPWAYVDDRTFHALSRGTPLTLGCLGLLTLLGLGTSAQLGRRAGAYPLSRVAVGNYGFSAAMVAPITGLALMYGLNDIVLEPLGREGAGPFAPLTAAGVIVPALALALLVRLRLLDPFGIAALTATACVSAALAVWLGLAPPGPALFTIAAAGLVPVAHDGFWRVFPGRTRSLAIVALGLGVALAATQLQAYGLAARELLAVAPAFAGALPALGLLPCAAVLAYGAALESSSHLAQRRDGRDS